MVVTNLRFSIAAHRGVRRKLASIVEVFEPCRTTGSNWRKSPPKGKLQFIKSFSRRSEVALAVFGAIGALSHENNDELRITLPWIELAVIDETDVSFNVQEKFKNRVGCFAATKQICCDPCHATAITGSLLPRKMCSKHQYTKIFPVSPGLSMDVLWRGLVVSGIQYFIYCTRLLRIKTGAHLFSISCLFVLVVCIFVMFMWSNWYR